MLLDQEVTMKGVMDVYSVLFLVFIGMISVLLSMAVYLSAPVINYLFLSPNVLVLDIFLQ